MNELCVSSGYLIGSTAKWDILSYIESGTKFHREMGFDGIDFPMTYIETLGENWGECIDHALRCAEQEGRRIVQCHLPFSVSISTNPEELPAFNQKMHHAIDAASRLGADYAVLHPNAISLPMEQYSRQEQKDTVLSHLGPFVDHAERVGVKVVIENMRAVPSHTPSHRYCQEPDELCEIADALGIGVCWDFGHANTTGIKQSEALAYIGDRLKVVHINDNHGDQDEHLPPFCGTVDWKDAMAGLAAIGFSGPLNYELSIAKIPPALRKAFVQYIRETAEVLKQYRKGIC